MSVDSDELQFAEDPIAVGSLDRRAWKVLIVDDEQSIHDVTCLALHSFEFDGHPLKFLHAYSAKEASDILRETDNVAVILLDVVMETPDAGLKLVNTVRNELKNSLVRIILRTGQPGEAPERQVIQQYDINDYKNKTELTKDRLYTSLYSALRSYRDIVNLNHNQQGLEKVISSTNTLHKIQAFDDFVSGLLLQMVSVIGIDLDAFFSKSSGFVSGKSQDNSDQIVMFGTGLYKNKQGMLLKDALEADTQLLVEQALDHKESQYSEKECVLLFEEDKEHPEKSVIYLGGDIVIDDTKKRFVELFCKNISVAYHNMVLNKELEDTQKEIVYMLGNISEFRNQETSMHVNRVAQYSALLAELYGLSKADCELLKFASPLHDIGKVALPDSILLKPDKLNDAEFEIMKSHAEIGYEMLKGSNKPILKAAAIIAGEHQEKWDGSGYPKQLSGDDIHVYARITSIADVYDALASKRCYKNGWDNEKILDYFKEQKGKHFDPKLVDLFLDNFTQFAEIRTSMQE